MGDNLIGMTRVIGGGVSVAATCLENWDMMTLIKLARADIFSERVHQAVDDMMKYVRTDLAHERFDCDWERDWKCMTELLHAMGRPHAADDLRSFCESKKHSRDAGDELPHLLFFIIVIIIITFLLLLLRDNDQFVRVLRPKYRSTGRLGQAVRSSLSLGEIRSPGRWCRRDRCVEKDMRGPDHSGFGVGLGRTGEHSQPGVRRNEECATHETLARYLYGQ